MRKTLICMLAMLMLLSSVLVACGGGDSGAEKESGKNSDGNSAESSDCVHEAITDAAVEATCTAPGKTEGSHCAKCGKILVAQKIIPIEHLFVDGKCTRCGLEISKGLKYELNEDGNSYSVTGIGSCTDTDLVIPPTYKEKPVTNIGYNAFFNCLGFTSATIPNSVTSIGRDAFDNCRKLTSITIPDSVTSIGNEAFHCCSSLTGATIPDSVTSIGGRAFSGCTELTSIIIGTGVTNIGSGAFEGTAYYYDESNWENGVLYIGKYLISARHSISGSSIKDGTVCIAYGAFWGCSELTSVTVPDSVTYIGDMAFANCSGLTSVNISDLAAWCNINFIGLDGSCYSNPLYYAKHLYLKGSEITKLVIPDEVTDIGNYAFYNCEKITSVTIPDSVMNIGDWAFFDCSGLTSVTIPDSVTSIGYGTFSDCSGLTSVTIPNSVTSIENGAFSGCSGLTSVTIPDSVTSIGSGAFSDCSELKSITIPDSVTSIGSWAFTGTAYYNKESNWRNDVLYIGKYLIKAKHSLSGSYSIKEGTVYIADDAFYHCEKLTSITIPDSVISIGGGAFCGCEELTSVTYNGTKGQWEEISKGGGWKSSTGLFTVYCTDGNISKADA